jgi:ABC-type transport system involved in multi-copper enzyme maturation permease subunit
MFQMYIGELFKFYKRPLATYFSGFVFVVFAMAIFSKFAHFSGKDEKTTYLFINDLTFPNIYFSAIDVSKVLFAFCGLIMTCSIFGNEYAWNTIKTISIRGTGRIDLVQSKLLAILSIIVFYIICGSVMFLLVGTIMHEKITSIAQPNTTTILGVFAFVKLLIVLLALLPYIGIGAFFTLATRSSAIGITIGIVYLYIVELFLKGILTLPLPILEGWAQKIPDYFISSQMQKINNVNLFTLHSGWEYITQITEPISISLVYAALFYIACVWIIKKRDILN